jgi:hypothetical protein
VCVAESNGCYANFPREPYALPIPRFRQRKLAFALAAQFDSNNADMAKHAGNALWAKDGNWPDIGLFDYGAWPLLAAATAARMPI